ncbi:MAG TPA: RNA polymerase sigma factor [Steroidobacteraceae bacterium]|nr:RNA polymerase sigma factor [Steroidobacteraceae bacterium]
MKADSVRLPAPLSSALMDAATDGRSSSREQSALGRAQDGEIAAFGELVCLHQAAIYSLAVRMLGVREDAQELAQDVFLLLHRHLAQILSVAHLHAWLRRTVCHRAIDRLRSRARHIVLPLEAAEEQQAAAEELDPMQARQLRQLVASLPPTPRAVVLLRYQEDLDPPEISELLGLPLNTVKSHLRRSLSLIRSRCTQ